MKLRGLSARETSRLSKGAISDRKIGLLISDSREQDITVSKLDGLAAALDVKTSDLLDEKLIELMDFGDDLNTLSRYFLNADEEGRRLIMEIAYREHSRGFSELPTPPRGTPATKQPLSITRKKKKR
jgi:DNA-binding Xre family transcriptional regulator